MTVKQVRIGFVCVCLSLGCVSGAVPSEMPGLAKAFALQDVRLLDGPFKTAMERDGTYMLSLAPDRLLHNFRVNAGLPSSAEPLGNWEKPTSELRGHLTGHYLSACALMYASTGDARFKERADQLAGELVKCQAALGSSGYLSAFTAESCNTYNMLKLTRHLFAWNASAAQADFYERALYNHILASQDPRTGQMAYHIPVYGGWFMPYNLPNESCWCCTGSGFENHAKYGDSIYWHDAAGLYVNLFIPSELAWREKGVTLRQETCYPEEETTRLTVRCERPAAFALRVRHPGWARRGLTLTVNGERVAHDSQPGSFVAVTREWKDGDCVQVTVPMNLRLEAMPDNPSRAAICYGPVVLAGELGTDGIVPPMPYAVKQSDFFKVKQPEMPVLLAGVRPVEEWIEPVPGKPLTFRTKGVGQPKDLTLVAFYKLVPQRFSLYWDILTADQWKAQRAALAQREQRDRDLAERTLDAAGIGEAKAEKAHNLQGENTKSGTFSNRSYRVADKGGWFTFDLKAPAGQPVALHCTYWGSDAGPRAFDVFANGVRLATVTLDHNRPGEFYDEEYALPEAALAGKPTVTVKIQAHPGKIAGGVFDVRLVRAPTSGIVK